MDLKILHDIDAERERQKREWDLFHDEEHTANDWVALICRFLGRMNFMQVSMDSDFHDDMVKVAALAVAALEACKDK